MAAAQGAGLKFATASLDQTHQPGERILTIFFAKGDAFTVENIFNLNSFNTVRANDVVKEAEAAVQAAVQEKSRRLHQRPDAEEIQREKNEQFLKLFSKSKDKVSKEQAQDTIAKAQEQEEVINPMTPARTTLESPSVTKSGNIGIKEEVTPIAANPAKTGNSERPSIRAKILAYREEMREESFPRRKNSAGHKNI